MKKILRACVAALLGQCAHAVIRKYHPKIVMITGSVGKTSTKDAIAAALSHSHFIWASEKSYNSEFGVPLTILGVKNPWSNLFAWLHVFKEVLALLLLPNHYPKILVLEVGADHPGDLAKILRIATPDAVVVTKLPEVPVHVEAYATPEAVRDEEFAPAYALASGAPLILNAEDTYALAYAKRIQASVITFGFSENSDAQIGGSSVYVEDGEPAGMESTLDFNDKTYKLRVPGVLGRAQLLAPAAAVCLASALGMKTEEAIAGIESYVPPSGRARLIKGRHGSTLIDDTYNASPTAVEEVLRALKAFPAKRRIAVLGDMLELGRYSVSEHERIGTLTAECVDVLATVGIRARKIAEAAQAAGLSDAHIFSFDHSESAAEELLKMVGEGDVVLIKGSQSIRAERVTEALLRDSKDAELLVRQDAEWKRR
jgi:UDP-N-acetylmuramoyl-tripeptide--D-alanyl-D-alanine ligase